MHYSPKINPEQVKRLYLLKMSYASLGIRKPMTEIVDEALDIHIPKEANEIIKSGGTLIKPNEIFLSEF